MTAGRPSPRQLDALVAVVDVIDAEHRPPTLREVASKLGITHGAVRELLGRLESQGLIVRERRKSRAIWVTDRGRRTLRLHGAPKGAV